MSFKVTYPALKERNVDEYFIEGAYQLVRFPCVMCIVCQDQSVHKAFWISRRIGIAYLNEGLTRINGDTPNVESGTGGELPFVKRDDIRLASCIDTFLRIKDLSSFSLLLEKSEESQIHGL